MVGDFSPGATAEIEVLELAKAIFCSLGLADFRIRWS